MSYYGTNVSNSASAFTQTGYSAQVMHWNITLNPSDNPGLLTDKEIEKLNMSMKIHEKSLSLLGQRVFSLSHSAMDSTSTRPHATSSTKR